MHLDIHYIYVAKKYMYVKKCRSNLQKEFKKKETSENSA
jgi:hypothetical protein